MKINSIIEQIYLDKINSIPLSEEYYSLYNKAFQAIEKLQKELPNKKSAITNIMDLLVAMQAEQNLCNFIYGFKLGLSMGAEVFLLDENK